MSRKKNISLVLTGLAVGFGIAWLVKRRSSQMPGLATWQGVLAEKHGSAATRQLAGQIRQRYAALLSERPLPENPILRKHATENILPGLALYQILLQELNDDRQAALAEVDAALRAWTLAKSRLLLAPLKLLPAPFRVFKLAFAQMMKKFPVEGWDFTFIENNDDKIAFNGTRCFYLNTLSAYGAPELTASFCKTDDVMAELFPPEVKFVRPHTLGRGDAVCDFQYYRVEQS
jgi:hypothetical protein